MEIPIAYQDYQNNELFQEAELEYLKKQELVKRAKMQLKDVTKSEPDKAKTELEHAERELDYAKEQMLSLTDRTSIIKGKYLVLRPKRNEDGSCQWNITQTQLSTEK